MATNNQVNIVNINNLPKTQQVFDGNYFIVQSDLGTQIIDWTDLGVLKLDTDGNGSYNGTLTGVGIEVSNATVANLLGSQYFSNGIQGVTTATDYYNSFTFTNGLLTSATYNFGSPEYLDIVQNQLPTLTATLLNNYKSTYTSYKSVPAWNTATNNGIAGVSAVVVFDTLPLGVTINDVQYTDFTVAQDATSTGIYELSTTPFVYNKTDNNGAPQVFIFAPQQLGQPYVAKLEFTYT